MFNKLYKLITGKNLKYTFYVGLTDKDVKKQIISTEKAVKKIIEFFPNGATITLCRGIYHHQDGSGAVIEENTLKIEVIDFDLNIDPYEKIAILKKAYNQESIALEKAWINSELV